jgi:hypothetical protein
MTEQQLRDLLAEKGYTYHEEQDSPPSTYTIVYAIKGSDKKPLGTKKNLISSSVAFFLQNKAYRQL